MNYEQNVKCFDKSSTLSLLAVQTYESADEILKSDILTLNESYWELEKYTPVFGFIKLEGCSSFLKTCGWNPEV